MDGKPLEETHERRRRHGQADILSGRQTDTKARKANTTAERRDENTVMAAMELTMNEDRQTEQDRQRYEGRDRTDIGHGGEVGGEVVWTDLDFEVKDKKTSATEQSMQMEE